LRNVVFQFEDSPAFALALREGDQELAVPEGEAVGDGEWVLAIFEVGKKHRATAAAARAIHSEAGGPAVLAFERRDWERLVLFAEAGSLKTRASSPTVPSAAPTKPSPRRKTPAAGVAAAGAAARRTTPTGTRAATPAAGGRSASAVPESPAAGARSPSTPSFAHWRGSDPFTQGPHARVLVVDDDRDIREVVGAMLDAVGLTVESATSAEEALERVRAHSFDLLVLDWNLPGMTGVELCRLIRRDPQLSTLPVLFLTAHASSHDVVEAFASGADDYVVKPFRAPELGARIFGLLRRARMSAAAS
jgi:two-component system phosphate regulon response regulator PhoB